MTILNVVKDVCLAVGVNPLTSLFASSIQPRTQAELLSLANEMAQRIAYDVREWTALKVIGGFIGDGLTDAFTLPQNFKRMLLTSQVYPSWAPLQPLAFIADTDQWVARRMSQQVSVWGEWTLLGDQMLIYPRLDSGKSVSFTYLDKNCIKLFAGGNGDVFMNDGDTFRINERLLKLAMIWQWKANKGSPYAEDMGTYTDALMNIAGPDKPAPIIIDKPPPDPSNVAVMFVPP